MLPPMVERVFLGWDRPFLQPLVEWLLERREELPSIRVVVPTAQSGRRLREVLAEAAGSILSPAVVTPGSFLQSEDPGVTEDWVERVAWVEVLEHVDDWSAYEALFPEKPGEGRDWAGGLSSEMLRLRRSLQENGLTLRAGSHLLRESIEAERWEALARLEDLVERKLAGWSLKSRSRKLAAGLKIPGGISRIVLAGITDMPPLVDRTLLAWSGNLTALIAAPDCERDLFSATGRPLSAWTSRPIPWPGSGSVSVAADPRQQAAEALRLIAMENTPSDEVSLGSADPETGDQLALVFSRQGWPTFHPAAAAIKPGLWRWLKIWNNWLSDPALAVMADLLALPETAALVGGKRAQKAKALAELRDRWMIARTEDLQRRIDAGSIRGEYDREAANDLLEAARSLESWRAGFLREDFATPMSRLLEKFSASSPEACGVFADWISEAAPMMKRVNRSAGFWIEAMLSAVPSPAPQPPDGRVLDVQGWLELLFERGNHLVLCGMNEGKVPARDGGEPWLGEASRTRLGLVKDADRAARDAFLYRSLLESRRVGGRVDILCGKSGSGGETLLPSRLLLAAERADLPDRVKTLFREIEPPEAGLRWEADWLWKLRQTPPPERLNVTSLADYLTCPFRYYLKHAVGMRASETGRGEWNARDFGTVAHEVLERWGRDTEAREFEKTEALHGWLSAELDRVVAGWFGTRVPLAVRIQTESLRNRFQWLARVQAVARVEGWEIIDVERKVEIPVAGGMIVAKIDRIDRHRTTGEIRVLDYKTGKVEGVEKAHRKKITAATRIPLHLGPDGPATDGGYLWQNLQLPLYAAALVGRGEPLPVPCYFTLGSTSADVAIHLWETFDADDLSAAGACAEWVAEKILAGDFWPPAEKVVYDDYRILAAGGTLEESFAPRT